MNQSTKYLVKFITAPLHINYEIHIKIYKHRGLNSHYSEIWSNICQQNKFLFKYINFCILTKETSLTGLSLFHNKSFLGHFPARKIDHFFDNFFPRREFQINQLAISMLRKGEDHSPKKSYRMMVYYITVAADSG